MNRIFKALALSTMLMFSVVCGASALTVAFDHDGGANGYTMYWKKTDGTGETYNKTVEDGAIKQVVLDDGYFEPGATYTFYATAYNDRGESVNSEELVHMIPTYTPPVNHLPAVLFLLLGEPTKPEIL